MSLNNITKVECESVFMPLRKSEASIRKRILATKSHKLDAMSLAVLTDMYTRGRVERALCPPVLRPKLSVLRLTGLAIEYVHQRLTHSDDYVRVFGVHQDWSRSDVKSVESLIRETLTKLKK